MSFCKPMTRLVRDDAAAAFGLLSVSTNTEATITNTITSVRSAIERDRKKLISLSSSRSRIGRPKGANRIKRYVRVTFASGQTRGRRVFLPVSRPLERGLDGAERDVATGAGDHRGDDSTDHATSKAFRAHIDEDRLGVRCHIQTIEGERTRRRLRHERAKVVRPNEE